MGFRMRKSIKLAPGVRLNVSKSGVGASVGGRGGRYSVHSSGRRTVSAGSGIVPGVSYQKSVRGGRSKGGVSLWRRAVHATGEESQVSSRRKAPIRHLALAERAQNHLAQGKKVNGP